MGAYWVGFILGGFSIMTLMAVLKAGAPPWLFISVFIAWAVVAVSIGERKRKQAGAFERNHRPVRLVYRKYRDGEGV